MENHSALVPSQMMLVFDDHVFRHGLVATLQREPDLAVVDDDAAPEAVDIAVVELATTRRPLDAVLRNGRPRCKVLVVSVFEEPTLLATLFHAGIAGYALKTQSEPQIINAVRIVLGGTRYSPPSIVVPSPQDPLPSLRSLTTRERQVYDLLIQGYTNDQIAAELHIARRTTETHRQHVLKKLAAHTVHDLIRSTAWQWTL